MKPDRPKMSATLAGDRGKSSYQRPTNPHISEMPLAEKHRTVAREIYRADDVVLPPPIAARLARFEETGFGGVGVCVAQTQYSFSADPKRLGAPDGHNLPVREVRLSAGAGFVVAICGDVMTMPGLPRAPASEHIDLADDGTILGLS